MGILNVQYIFKKHIPGSSQICYNLPSFRPMHQETICAKVYPEVVQTIKGNNYGLISFTHLLKFCRRREPHCTLIDIQTVHQNRFGGYSTFRNTHVPYLYLCRVYLSILNFQIVPIIIACMYLYAVLVIINLILADSKTNTVFQFL